MRMKVCVDSVYNNNLEKQAYAGACIYVCTQHMYRKANAKCKYNISYAYSSYRGC